MSFSAALSFGEHHSKDVSATSKMLYVKNIYIQSATTLFIFQTCLWKKVIESQGLGDYFSNKRKLPLRFDLYLV